MEHGTGEKTSSFQSVRRGGFMHTKQEHLPAKPYLDILVHYDAELVQVNGTIGIVRRATGIELPLEQRGKLQLLKILLDEFVTVDEVNAAISKYKASHP
jgi:hypothetical protein